MFRLYAPVRVLVVAALLVGFGAQDAAALIITVINNSDSGAGSLRQAILDANTTVAFDEIRFNLPAGQHTITPLTPLPTMTTSIDVNGTSQPGYAGVPIVGLNGATAAGTGLRSMANLSSVRGLAIYGFTTGVSMEGNLFVVLSNYIGLTAAGAGGSGNTGSGLSISGDFGSVGGTLAADRNVISGNAQNGMVIGSEANGNLIYGNYIGTNVAGTAAIGNGGYGIRDFGVANQIGTNTAGGGNLISGNARGISLESADPDGTSLRGNFIGLNAAGTAAVPNLESGVELNSDGNEVGGTFAGDRNVISGNGSNGITIGSNSSGNLIYANYIGTNAAGTAAVGNGGYGIRSFGADSDIGSNVAGSGNVISGNQRGISLESSDPAGTSVRGNIFGLNAAGNAKVGNTSTGIELRSSGNLVGGTTAAERNIVSGNGGTGISIYDTGTANAVTGNYIGTDVTGTVALGNGSNGITVFGDGHQIGGTAAGAGNVVSANTSTGISVGGDDNVIEGNRIGTNAAGTAALGNTGGVRLDGNLNQFGGKTAAAANLVSGNGSGLAVVGGDGNVIEGNRIGTNAAGTAAIANNGYAIRLIDATGNTIGGPAAGAGNLLSGNARGVAFDDDAPENILQGNIIGLALDGQTALGNQSSGVEIGSSGNLIGGGDPGTGNVIASNTAYGIVLQGPLAVGNLVQGNKIGVAKDGTTLRGNYYNLLFYGASGNTIGGTEAGEGNIIAGSVNAGVYVWFGTHNEILGNSIHSNGGQGIDLDPQGLAANDKLDPDTGSNEKQNFPVLTSALLGGGNLDILGTLSSQPSTSYHVEFFSSPTCDASGFGEGRTYLGAATVVSDEDGVADIDSSIPFASADTVITATATSPDGDTSEFSPCASVDQAAGPGSLQFSQPTFLGYEEQGFVTVLVSRNGGASGAVTVHYATSDNTATAPADYASTSGTLSFGDGEVVKSFTVPLVLDGPDGGDQQINLTLTNPTGGASLGAQSTSKVLLFDYDLSFPGVYISDATILEGDSGTKNASFTVTLTPTDHTVTFQVRTTAGTATEGVDFDGVEVDMSFTAGEAPKTVLVPIHGDTDIEGTEVFFLLVSGQIQPNGYAGPFGHGYILDDEGPLPPAECSNGVVQDPETCDDGDQLYTAGDYCSADCNDYACGIPTKADGVSPKSSDALFVLKAAVGGTNCDLRVCDVNSSNTVTSSDALLILKFAVGQNVTIDCPD